MVNHNNIRVTACHSCLVDVIADTKLPARRRRCPNCRTIMSDEQLPVVLYNTCYKRPIGTQRDLGSSQEGSDK